MGGEAASKRGCSSPSGDELGHGVVGPSPLHPEGLHLLLSGFPRGPCLHRMVGTFALVHGHKKINLALSPSLSLQSLEGRGEEEILALYPWEQKMKL